MTGQQLKNSILQMAVQGKLVPQDPNDEPASVLLERIRTEKEKLIKEGKIKKEKNPSVIFRGTDNLPYEKIGDNEPVCIADEVPFEIPESWAWVRLSSLGEIVGGGTPRTSDRESWINATIPWLTPADMKYITGKYVQRGERNISEYGLIHSSAQLMPAGSILYSSRAPIGYIAISKNSISTNQGFKSLVPVTDEMNDYLYYYLIALTPSIQAKASGTTFKEISGTDFGKTLIAIPPLNEQCRIVNKIEKVLPEVSCYTERETALAKLNSSFPEALKKSILQWAVQGKLVPQNPDDEPASILLERIRAEKGRLVKEGKIKRDKQESVIFRRDNSFYENVGGIERCIDDELPFEIPESWEWARWGNLSKSIQYGYNSSSKECGRIRMVRISDIQNNSVNWKDVPYCDIDECSIQAYILQENDILFARTGGTVGKSFLVNDVPYEAIYAGYLIRTRYNSKLLSPLFLKTFMESDLYWSQLRAGTTTTAQPNCNGKTLAKMLVPIPPLAEQHRIVAKIESILPALKGL